MAALALNTDISAQHQPTTSILQTGEHGQKQQDGPLNGRSESPQPLPRPPVSPISPSTSLAAPALPSHLSNHKSHTPTSYNTIAPPAREQKIPHRKAPPPQTHFIDLPAPLPISIDDNTDAAALRAAISILQIQRNKSRQDIKTLQDLKQGLIKDPDNFTQELLAGRLREEKRPDDPLQATFSGASEKKDIDHDDGDGEADQDIVQPDTRTLTESEQAPPSQYPPIPTAQNVIRCPPVNWAKYHIAGEPLDRMHDEQRKRPSLGAPAQDYPIHEQQQPLYSYLYGTPPSAWAARAAEHQIYAPYDPSRDRTTTVAEQMGIVGVQTRRSSKKPENAGAGFGGEW